MAKIRLIFLGDFLAYWFTLFLVVIIRFKELFDWSLFEKHLIPFFILYLFSTLAFYLFGLYDLTSIKPNIPGLKRFSLALVISFFLGIILFYFLPSFGIAPKTILAFELLGFGLLSFLSRRLFYRLYSNQLIKNLVLVGQKSQFTDLQKIIDHNPQFGLEVIAYVSSFHDAFSLFSEHENTIFVVDSSLKDIGISEIVALHQSQIEILDIAEAYEKYLYKIPVENISETWIIENIKINKDLLYIIFSRLFDIFFALVVLIVLSPVVLICAILIYLNDKGPVFYKQKRVGLNNKIFYLFKLRSMIVDSEKNGAVWSGKLDTRVTPVGRIMRMLHVDEIPQMINILKGDIALVGPRPERPEFVSELEKSIPYYELRHIIRPGFTGWAQIKYHYANTIESSKEKFEYDLYYIKNRNIFIDFGIILRTIQIIFTHV
jgi:exopolysaccharide biosynthesis polyprenyl glycosylphosphotransferase